ncbi:MAG: xylS [Pedosphaera sp.]|nr:xylS [Pedosphaera sp.]
MKKAIRLMTVRVFKTWMWLACFVALSISSLKANAIDIKLESGDVLRLEPVEAGIIRVRLSVDGTFTPSLMERYGIVRTNWEPCETAVVEKAGVVKLITANEILEVGRDGSMQLLDTNGGVICRQILPLLSKLNAAQTSAYRTRQASLSDYFKGERRSTGQAQIIGYAQTNMAAEPDDLHPFDLAPATSSFGLTFDIGETDRFYGLGTASARRLQLRGHAYRLWTQYRGNFGFNASKHDWDQTEGPIPLLLSTGGWGVFVNTTWVHYYDIGRYETNRTFIWGPSGQLDFYLLIGKTLPKLLDLYTEITGKPRLLPEFGYGLSFVANSMSNQHDVLEDMRLFRKSGIPCDTIGLEPQWMKKNYDFSHNVEWNSPDKFYMESWLIPDRGATMIGAMDRLGFKLSLWLCCDDDLTMEEERLVAQREGRGKDFPAEPDAWFNHLQKFVQQGVRAFKMDPGTLFQEHPNRQYYNGRTDLENHNLTQVLYHKQMCQGYEEFTGKRAMTHYCGAYAGVQHWGTTTMGDNGGGHKALIGMLNYAMSAHMNVSCDMETQAHNLTVNGKPAHANTPYDTGAEWQGIHFGFLQPWSQHNNWAYAEEPWLLGKQGEAIYRDYAQLRYSLMPYIYSAAYQGFLTAMPIMRPMPLMFTDDQKLADCSYEYMLGDSLLVVVFSDRVYLPAGRWIDYWTGTAYQGPLEMPCVYPINRAGGLFIRAGAIIPYWPDMDYVGEKPAETIKLQVYPDGQSDYKLYEDDGDSMEYLTGAVATTRFHCEESSKQVKFTIAPRRGNYQGMPYLLNYNISIHMIRPKSLTVSAGDAAENTSWSYDTETKTVNLDVSEDPERKTPLTIRCDKD